SGGLYKAGGTAWQHGFAVYNPLHTQQFGTWPVLSDLVTAWGPMVVAISWGSILFQCALPFMLVNRYTRIVALLGILCFHLGIADDDRRRRDLHPRPQLRDAQRLPAALVGFLGPAPGRREARIRGCLRGLGPPARREVAVLRRRQLDLRQRALVAYRALCRRSSCRRRSRFTASGAAPGLWPRGPRAGRPRRCHRPGRHRPAVRGRACRRSRAGPGDAAVGRRRPDRSLRGPASPRPPE